MRGFVAVCRVPLWRLRGDLEASRVYAGFTMPLCMYIQAAVQCYHAENGSSQLAGVAVACRMGVGLVGTYGRPTFLVFFDRGLLVLVTFSEPNYQRRRWDRVDPTWGPSV